MNHINFKTGAALFSAVIMGVFSMETQAKTFTPQDYELYVRNHQTIHPERIAKTPTPWSTRSFAKKNTQSFLTNETSISVDPSLSLDQIKYFDYLDGPDGSVWFYTAEYDVDYIEHSEWYTEEIIKGYTFRIYDSKFDKVGEISNRVKLKEGETGVRLVTLDPAVTRNFFNTDSNPEIIVYSVMNTETFQNNFYNDVYSLGGEKDEDGNDVCLLSYKGRIVDTFNAAQPGQPEDFYFTFVGADASDDPDGHYDNFVDFLNTYYMPLSIYSKAQDTSGPTLVFEKNIYKTRVSGDTTDGIYLITKTVNGNPYFIFSEYEKPYFIDPTGGAVDEEATPDNSLIIETYAVNDNKPVLVSTTTIPVEQVISDEHLMYTFLSIGSVSWKNDVDMLINGTPEAPAFLVARDVVAASSLEDIDAHYEIYDVNGKLVKSIASGPDAVILFDDNDNKEPEALFVNKKDEFYFFDVKGIYTGEKRFTLEQFNGGDPISASCARIKSDNGTYKYAFEMSQYREDEDGNFYIRVAWFDNNGALEKIDPINVGQDIQAAAVNLYSYCLDPYLYDNDDAMEYAVLVKRTKGSTTRNEFVVVDDNNEWLAYFTEEDGKGAPKTFSIIPGSPNHLLMVYEDNKRYNADIYPLPFITDSIGSIIDDNEEDSFTIAGDDLISKGREIEIYDTKGVMIVKGKDSLSLTALAKGIYIVVTSDSVGNKTSRKISL